MRVTRSKDLKVDGQQLNLSNMFKQLLFFISHILDAVLKGLFYKAYFIKPGYLRTIQLSCLCHYKVYYEDYSHRCMVCHSRCSVLS